MATILQVGSLMMIITGTNACLFFIGFESVISTVATILSQS